MNQEAELPVSSHILLLFWGGKLPGFLGFPHGEFSITPLNVSLASVVCRLSQQWEGAFPGHFRSNGQGRLDRRRWGRKAEQGARARQQHQRSVESERVNEGGDTGVLQ